MRNKFHIIVFFSLFILSNSVRAQFFFQAIGAYVAETSSRDGYRNLHSSKDINQDPLFLHTYPPSHRGGEYESWGVGVFLEMLNNDMWKWRTEIEYANKGSRETGGINPYFGYNQSGVNTSSRIQWNNYLKRYINLGLRFPTYAMIGVRAEYSLTNSAPAYTLVAGAFKKIGISGDAGLGMEFPLKKGWSLFAEEHYNPDLMPKYASSLAVVWGRTWETRIGVIYRWKRGIGAYDIDCNAPRYHGR